MGNWGGSHGADTATGDLTLTPTASGNYESGTQITININNAKYTNATATTGKDLQLSPSGSTNTLVLTSGTNITTRAPHTLTRTANGLKLTLQSADDKFTTGIYNVSLKITADINLSSSITLKQTTDTPYSLGTYKLTGVSGTTNFTGQPDSNALHSSHQGTKCCIFGNQNTWSDKDNRYGWHSFIILAPIKIFLAIIFLYCLHHRDSSIPRSIINQPKMSTFLSIIFYMCHECLLAVGFPLTRKGATST